MSKTTITDTDVALPSKYTELRGKIVDGSITKAETQELYDAFQNITPGTDRAIAVKKLCDDVYKDAGPDKFHDFVKQLAEVEKDVIKEKHSIPDNATPEQTKDIANARGNAFYRNSSLARNAMIFECVKEGLGKETFAALKDNNLEKAAVTLSEIKIPDRVKDTYKSINEFYRENKSETGAARNLTFHAMNGVVQQYEATIGEKEGRTRDEQSVKENKLMLDLNKVGTRGVFHKDKPGSLEAVMAQIEGKELNAQQIENSKEILKNVQKDLPRPGSFDEGKELNTKQIENSKEISKNVQKDQPRPSFFDRVKASTKKAQEFIKRSVDKVLDNVVPGRKKMNKMINEVINNSESAPKKQENDLQKNSNEKLPEEKSKTWQKAVSPSLKVEAPLQTPTAKLSQHRKGHGGIGS